MKLDRVIAVRTSKTVYRDGDDCIKVFDADHAKADIFGEALNQARMEAAGLNVPPVIRIDKFYGKWAIVTRYIKGKTLSRLMEEKPERRAEYIGALANLQADMHSRRGAGLSHMKDEIIERIARADIDEGARAALLQKAASLKNTGVCHGDFEPSNVLAGDDGALYILDWARATQGEPRVDAAWTYLLFKMEDVAAADEYLGRFCQESGLRPEEIMEWIPVAAAANSANANSRVREFLLSHADMSDCQ